MDGMSVNKDLKISVILVMMVLDHMTFPVQPDSSRFLCFYASFIRHIVCHSGYSSLCLQIWGMSLLSQPPRFWPFFSPLLLLFSSSSSFFNPLCSFIYLQSLPLILSLRQTLSQSTILYIPPSNTLSRPPSLLHYLINTPDLLALPTLLGSDGTGSVKFLPSPIRLLIP